MYDPPGTSLFYLRLAVGNVVAATLAAIGGRYGLAVLLGLFGALCFWKSLRAKGTDY
jgi:hypothetical protein